MQLVLYTLKDLEQLPAFFVGENPCRTLTFPTKTLAGQSVEKSKVCQLPYALVQPRKGTEFVRAGSHPKV